MSNNNAYFITLCSILVILILTQIQLVRIIRMIEHIG